MGFHLPVWDAITQVPIYSDTVAGRPAFDATHPAYLFDDSTTETVFVSFEMPHRWIEGSIVRPYVRWTAVDDTAGDVVWRLEYQLIDVGEAIDSYTTVSITSAASGVSGQHQVTSFGDISAAGKRLGTMMLCRLSRLGGDASDTYANDARVISIGVNVLVDGLGSIQELSKNQS